MNTTSFLSFEQQLKKERGYKKEFDFRAYKNDAPEQPKQKKETYSNGFGDTATQDSFTPSAYNSSQMNWVQSVTPQLQSKLYDSSGADSQARAYADNIKSQGLKRFAIDQADSLGAIQASNARRFGSLSNSDYDTNLKTMIRENNSALEDINAQYDMNYQNALNNYQNYYNNLLSTASGVGANLYNLGSGLSQNALNSSNATNNFNQQSYQNQLAQYNQQQAQNNAMYSNAAKAVATAIFLSDIKAKKNIKKIGEQNGINIYEFEYKPEYNQPEGKHIGVIAQEVEHIPNAVIEKDGIKYVNYSIINKLIA